MRTHSALELCHPGVVALYFLAVLALSMASFHPVLLACSVMAALSLHLVLKGLAATARMLLWILVLSALVTLVNPLLNPAGSTVLLRWGGHHAVYLEAVCYSLSMSCMLASVLLWFADLSAVLSSDHVLQLTGRCLPVIGLMLSMVMRLVPLFLRRGRTIHSVQQANTCACAGIGASAAPHTSTGPVSSRTRLRRRLRHLADRTRSAARLVNVLAGWGLEDSLETTVAMRARGWDATRDRTSCPRHVLRTTDIASSVLLSALIALSVACFCVVAVGFSFYPAVSALFWTPWYIPYVLLLFLPHLLELKEVVTCRR